MLHQHSKALSAEGKATLGSARVSVSHRLSVLHVARQRRRWGKNVRRNSRRLRGAVLCPAEMFCENQQKTRRYIALGEVDGGCDVRDSAGWMRRVRVLAHRAHCGGAAFSMNIADVRQRRRAG